MQSNLLLRIRINFEINLFQYCENKQYDLQETDVYYKDYPPERR